MRRFTKLLATISAFSTIFLFVYIVYQIIQGPIFLVKTIYIEASPDILPDVANIIKPSNLILLSSDELANSLSKRFPYVRSVEIRKQLPDTLFIKIYEREPEILITQNGKEMYLDASGKLLDLLPRHKILSFPRLNCAFPDPEKSEEVQKVLKVVIQIQTEKQNLGEISCPENFVEFHFPETVFRFSTSQAPERIAASLLFLLKQFRIEGKYPDIVDLRFEKPVLLPKGMPEASPSTATAN